METGGEKRGKAQARMKYLDTFPNSDNESKVSIGSSSDKFALR
jgi:hypothetical protein